MAVSTIKPDRSENMIKSFFGNSFTFSLKGKSHSYLLFCKVGSNVGVYFLNTDSGGTHAYYSTIISSSAITLSNSELNINVSMISDGNVILIDGE